MFEFHHHTGKRVMALLLVFAMMFAMMGQYTPTWFAAFAEGEFGDSDSSDSEAGFYEDHESSFSDGGSSDSRESSHSDSDSSDSHESSHSDSDSSDSRESLSSDSGSSDSRESSHSDGDSSDSRESSSDSGASDSRESSSDSGASSASDDDAGSDAPVKGDAAETSAAPSEAAPSASSDDAGDENENSGTSSEGENASGDAVASEGDQDGAVPGAVQGASETEEPGSADDHGAVGSASEGEFQTEVDNTDEKQTEVDNENPPRSTDETADTTDEGADATDEGIDADAPDDAAGEDNAADAGDDAGDEAPESENTYSAMRVSAFLTSAAPDAAEDEEAEFTTTTYTAPVVLSSPVEASSGEEKTCELQQKIDDALKAVSGTLSGRLQVVLTRGASYDGDVSISAADIGGKIEEDFELEISEEANGESDGSDAAASGPATFTGTMNIKGVNVAIRGVGVTGMVNVESAKLNYTGSAEADTVHVTAGSGAKVTVNTSAGDDAVTANATAGGAVTVDTGAGHDTVISNVNEGNATIQTGDGKDSVTASFAGSNVENELNIKTGSGDDSVNLTNDSYKGTVSIITGSGSDTVEVDAHTAGNGGITVDTGVDDDTVTLKNSGSGHSFGSIKVLLGAGDDRVNVDMSISNAVDGGKEKADVILEGGAGDDTAHFTGRLGDGSDTQKRVVIGTDSLKLDGGSNTLNVSFKDFNRLTDSLENKETVKLTPNNGVLKYEAENPGINYVVQVPAKDIKKLTITSKGGAYLPLSNLVINIPSDGNKLVISEGTVIDVRGLNVALDSGNIQINGTIVAEDVSITASAGGKFANVKGDSKIVITDKGAIYSSGDVMIIAKVTMAGPMLDTSALVGLSIDLAPINSINVKLAHASIDIAGKVYAGLTKKSLDSVAEYLSGDKKDTKAADPAKDAQGTGKDAKADEPAKPVLEFDRLVGSVTVTAEDTVLMGVSADGTPLDSGWPVAVSVANVEAAVNIEKGAVVEAARNVAIASQSTLKAGTRASSGLKGAPAAAAVAVLINNVHTTVDGTVNAHYGSASVTSDGTLEATTVADRGSGQTMISGGYAAVTVALQDVKTVVNNSAQVTAEMGNVAINSNATEKVVDKAAASSAKEGESGGSGGVLSLLGTVKDKLANWIDGRTPSKRRSTRR